MTTVKEIACAFAIVGVLLGLNSYFQTEQDQADADYRAKVAKQIKQLERKADKLLFAGIKP